MKQLTLCGNILTFSTTLSFLEEAIICLDEQYRIIDFNHASENLYNLKKQNVLNKSYFSVCLEKNIEVITTVKILKENGLQKKPAQCTTTIADQIFEWHVTPLTLDNKNFLLVIGKNITKKMKDEKNDRDNLQKHLELVSDAIAGNHWWKDTNGIYLGCNEQLIKTLGLNSKSDVIGKTDYELPWSTTADYLVQNDLEVMRNRVPQRREELITSNTGEKLYFMVVKSPLKDNSGKIIGTVGSSIDITELKRTEAELRTAKEKAEKSNKAKSDFLAVVSHELRTPLTGILGVVEILQKENGTLNIYEREEYLEKINTASTHLLTIINNILDFAKLNENKFTIVNVAFNIEEPFQKVLDILQTKASEKAIGFTFNLPSDFPRKFIGDSKALLQILLNIIGNAIKFTDKGGVSISVIQEKIIGNTVKFRIDIEDTGIGIPANKLNKIFERFEQVNSSKKRAYGGTGLGLSVSKNLLDLLGGNITVKSKFGKGSIFSINLTLELDIHEQKREAEEKQTPPLNFSKLKNCQALLVEDDPLIQMVHKHKFEQLECHVDVATTGKEALSLCKKKNYDIIFMDIGLPDISGNKVIEEIRVQKNKNQHTCIIALTAYSDEKNHAEAKRSGADCVLSKPLEEGKLVTILKHYSSKSFE